MAQTFIPTGDNTLLKDAMPMRKIGWLERFLGPENYRILTGLLKTPASIRRFCVDRPFYFYCIGRAGAGPAKTESVTHT